MTDASLWDRYRRCLCQCDAIGMTLDVSRMRFPDDFVQKMTPALDRAFDAMAALEGGAIANPDEQRMVGHYWLRDPALAPDGAIRDQIEQSQRRVRDLGEAIHRGDRRSQDGGLFRHVLIAGIGGSALGPQLLSDAFGDSGAGLTPWFADNTDPDGLDRLLARLGDELGRTLTVVVSKSGGTKETRNAMLEIAHGYRRRRLTFEASAVAITCPGSQLDRAAAGDGWLARLPLWDWVGGRTSIWSPVGLLPAALMGIDTGAFLDGAREADRITRIRTGPPPGGRPASGATEANPAALLALMWHYAGGGRGTRDMVVLPYKDRLAVLGRYLQQLVMESLGKRTDRNGGEVHQGLTVYGNKGSTDQHALLQQLQDGPDDFFATFVEVLRDRQGPSIPVEPRVASGDYLHGFLHGTRNALYDAGRDSLTITLDELTPHRLGALLAVFERAVGLYAELIDINAYHQPGVEASKGAAAGILALQAAAMACLEAHRGDALTAEDVAQAIGHPERVEDVYHVLVHLAANPDRHVVGHPAPAGPTSRFGIDPDGPGGSGPSG